MALFLFSPHLLQKPGVSAPRLELELYCAHIKFANLPNFLHEKTLDDLFFFIRANGWIQWERLSQPHDFGLLLESSYLLIFLWTLEMLSLAKVEMLHHH